MSETVRCPKCRSNAQVLTVRHPFIWGKTEAAFHCMWCGTRKYGEAAQNVIEEDMANRVAEINRQVEQRKRDEEGARHAAEERRLLAERVERERVEREAEAAREAAREASREAAREAKVAREAEAAREVAREAEAAREAAREAEAARAGAEQGSRQATPKKLVARARTDAARRRAEVKAATRAAAVAALGGDDSALCAYHLCDKPHGKDRRYCSKSCSDHIARARYDERKGRRGAQVGAT